MDAATMGKKKMLYVTPMDRANDSKHTQASLSPISSD